METNVSAIELLERLGFRHWQRLSDVDHISSFQRNVLAREQLFGVHRHGLSAAHNDNFARIAFPVIVRSNERFCQGQILCPRNQRIADGAHDGDAVA